jgi:hypothetical protein
MLLSVTIANYNYERYVADCINSALALDYQPKEIVVVDDGSTDGSRAIITALADAHPTVIRTIFKENGGHMDAVNVGILACSGDIIYTLDSDDAVYPDMMQQVMAVWRPGVSKVQFSLELVDADGAFLWFNKPVLASPKAIHDSLLQNGDYPCPPTSGSVYSAEFLKQVVPVTPLEIWSDAALNYLAPLYGDVIALEKPLGIYRQHDRNTHHTPEYARQHMRQAEMRDTLIYDHCRKLGIDIAPGLRDRDPIALQHRLVSLKLDAQSHPARSDGKPSILRKLARALSQSKWMPPSQRFVILTWATMMAFAPRNVAVELCKLRYIPGYRPKSLVALLELSGAARGTRVGATQRRSAK